LTDAEVAPLGVDTPDFVNGNKIPAGSTANFLYRVSVITTLDSGEEEIVSASSRFTLSVNMPPSSGVCEVGLVEGFALGTDFSISCNGWKDEANSAIRYEFFAITPTGNVILQPRLSIVPFQNNKECENSQVQAAPFHRSFSN